jgi:hypothetical protein
LVGFRVFGENFRPPGRLSLVPFFPHLFVFFMLAQSRAEYVGGTIAVIENGKSGAIESSDERYFAFYAKGAQLRVPYDRIDLIEYGQKVNRRLLEAIVISPMFLLSRSRKHFLTVGYRDENGKQQALVFRVDKNDIRATLVSLEARTGLKVQYQDSEARKAGRG